MQFQTLQLLRNNNELSLNTSFGIACINLSCHMDLKHTVVGALSPCITLDLTYLEPCYEATFVETTSPHVGFKGIELGYGIANASEKCVNPSGHY